MSDVIKDLEEMCEYVTYSIKDANKRLRLNGGKAITTGDADYLDKLTHILKSIKGTIKIIEELEYEDNYSERYYDRDEYRDRGMSHARGRGRTARRDSMGRFSRSDGGYSYHDGKEDMIDRLRDIMDDAPDEKHRQEIQRLLSKIETM